MPDREKVIKGLNCHFKRGQCDICPYGKENDCEGALLFNALALLKEQEETINDLTDTIRQLNQHIKDLSEYMTPYGKLEDVKAYTELLKEQEAVAIVWKFGFPHCPVCGQMLPEGDAVKYCLHCGKSVKWE